ncbi:SRF-type transcription factor (DNA-binding and dimerization domain)-domain-containing protein [Phlyctochytrium arcticum]|nr:SRF-type transcription factor (DNA-binding and dimerization domain)-domain-containing protein [Phlyctochytrium arcticum]
MSEISGAYDGQQLSAADLAAAHQHALAAEHAAQQHLQQQQQHHHQQHQQHLPQHDGHIPLKRSASDAALPDDQDEHHDDDGSDEDGKTEKRQQGRRKIKIEYIDDKSRRHITFSKRKAGIMKKAYELSTLTGTQVLLLVASETGHVYTFATPKLQPLITKPDGKNLIQACLNAPDPHPGQPVPYSPAAYAQHGYQGHPGAAEAAAAAAGRLQQGAYADAHDQNAESSEGQQVYTADKQQQAQASQHAALQQFALHQQQQQQQQQSGSMPYNPTAYPTGSSINPAVATSIAGFMYPYGQLANAPGQYGGLVGQAAQQQPQQTQQPPSSQQQQQQQQQQSQPQSNPPTQQQHQQQQAQAAGDAVLQQPGAGPSTGTAAPAQE